MEALDAGIRRVAAQKGTWKELSARTKLGFIDQLMDRAKTFADEFLEAAVEKRDFVECVVSTQHDKERDGAPQDSCNIRNVEEIQTERGKRFVTAEPSDEQQRTSCTLTEKNGYEGLITDRSKFAMTKTASETSQVTHSVLLLATWLSVTRETYDAIVRTGKPPPPLSVESLQRPRPEIAASDSRRDLTLAKVAPRGLLFATLLSGGSVYVAVDGPVEQLPVTQKSGEVVAILGAGNYDCPADIVNCLFVDNSVCIYKPSPANRKITPVVKKIFAPLVKENYLFFAEGDGTEEGHFLLHHPLVTKWYLTGAAQTANRILWNSPHPPQSSQQQLQQQHQKQEAKDREEQQQEQRKQHQEVQTEDKGEQLMKKPVMVPQLNKSCILELGSCTPWIVAPGRWSDRALHWHARNIAFALLFNGGHICVHPQLLVTSKRWPQREKFLQLVRSYQQDILYVGCFYPDYAKRIREAREKLLSMGLQPADFEVPVSVPLSAKNPASDVDYVIFATGLPEDNFLTREEAFGPVCGEVALDTPATVADFLPAAVRFVNSKVHGTLMVALSVRVVQTEDEQALQNAIVDLQYGSILINVVPLLNFLFPNLLWGGYPSSTFADLKSGISHFGNVDGYKRAVKSVIRLPFYNFTQLVLMPWTKRNVYQMNKIQTRTARAFLDRRPGTGWFTSTQHMTKLTAAFLAHL